MKEMALTDLELRNSKDEEFLCVSKMSIYYVLFKWWKWATPKDKLNIFLSVYGITFTYIFRDFRLPQWSRWELHSSGL